MNAFPNEVIDIVGIGASTLDRFIVVDHFPMGREVQEAISSTTDGGGPVATALATAGKYGSRTVMIDRIGDDMVGRYILEDFHKYNVNTEGIQVD
ncbi:MAG: PfkB family carbohydrate kinase, partial [Veillonella sp.]|nr:PfkB family carbohydrate kinase [Veillonella sp.]